MSVQIIGIELLVYTREDGHTKPVRRRAALDERQSKRLLNFATHNLHGGRIQLHKLPEEGGEEKRIILPP